MNVPDIDNFRPLHVAEDRLMRGILLANGAECDISIAAALDHVELVREMLEGNRELANYSHTKKTTKKEIGIRFRSPQGMEIGSLLRFCSIPVLIRIRRCKPIGKTEPMRNTGTR